METVGNPLLFFSRDKRDAFARHLIPLRATLLDALSAINTLSGESMTLFVYDDKGRIVGSVTDGDIRRSLLRGNGPDSMMEDAMCVNFKALHRDDDVFRKVRELKKEGIDVVPVLDADGMALDFIDLRTRECILPLDAVLMAGGRGERLRPLTLEIPKPLLKVGPKCIIDYNVDRLVHSGIDNIFVTVNYLHEQIESHFSETVDGVRIKCILEPMRLGTIGSLSLVDDLRHDNVLVMNSDLLTTLSFERMYAHHLDSEADITMAVVPYTVSVPFALVRTEGDHISDLEEKPVYNYFANAGVYIVRRELLCRLKQGEYADAPDFVREVIADGGKAAYYPVDGLWVDIGSPSDYRRACELASLLESRR